MKRLLFGIESLFFCHGFCFHKNAVQIYRQPIVSRRQPRGDQAELLRAGGLLPPVCLPDDFTLGIL